MFSWGETFKLTEQKNIGRYIYINLFEIWLKWYSNRHLNEPPIPSETNKNSKENPKLGQNFQTFWFYYIRVIHKGQCKMSFKGSVVPNLIFPSQMLVHCISKVLRGLHTDYVAFWTERRKEYGCKLYIVSLTWMRKYIKKTSVKMK